MEVPPKIQFFLWRLFCNRLPSRNNLKKRNVPMMDDKCVFCVESEETIMHSLFSCKIIYELWKKCHNWFCCIHVCVGDVRAHFSISPSCLVWKSEIGKWRIVWFAMALSIWNFKSQIIFSNVNMDKETLWHKFTFLAWSWS